MIHSTASPRWWTPWAPPPTPAPLADRCGPRTSLRQGFGTAGGPWANDDTHNYYHADGGGNITYLVNSSQGLAASYKYDAYGNLVSQSGSLAGANVYRFSSKEWLATPGLYYYGYRWYAPNLQRWPNRDPLQEKGGVNLYGFVYNNPIGLVDTDGRVAWGWPVVPPPGYPPTFPPHDWRPPPRPPMRDPGCVQDCWDQYQADVEGILVRYGACMAVGGGGCMEASPAARPLCFLLVATACGSYSIAAHTAAAARLAGCIDGCPCGK